MDNVLENKQKKCIQWSVQAPASSGSLIVSDTFLLQEKDCNLKFYTGAYGTQTPWLLLECNDELQLPITAVTRVVSNSRTLAHLITTISSLNQYIWNYTTEYTMTNRPLVFDLIFYSDNSCEDKQIQNPSYMNADVYTGSLTEAFSKLLQTEMDHDVEMKCDGHSLKTHKLVLSARSDVFKAMLKADFLEGQSKVIEIQDMDVSCFRDFVRYLYTDIMPELTFDNAKVLYEAGDKYAIRSLMLRCAEFLQDNLSPENVYECYALADAHSDQKLKDGIISYLLDKKIYVQEEYWLPFHENFPKVALEVYRLSYKINKKE